MAVNILTLLHAIHARGLLDPKEQAFNKTNPSIMSAFDASGVRSFHFRNGTTGDYLKVIHN